MKGGKRDKMPDYLIFGIIPSFFPPQERRAFAAGQAILKRSTFL
ncbi:hypothetical protein [Collimonas sp.]